MVLRKLSVTDGNISGFTSRGMGDLGNLQHSRHLGACLIKHLARNEVKVQQEVWLYQAVVQTLKLTLMLLSTPSNQFSTTHYHTQLFLGAETQSSLNLPPASFTHRSAPKEDFPNHSTTLGFSAAKDP